jgi:hypothetical protein
MDWSGATRSVDVLYLRIDEKNEVSLFIRPRCARAQPTSIPRRCLLSNDPGSLSRDIDKVIASHRIEWNGHNWVGTVDLEVSLQLHFDLEPTGFAYVKDHDVVVLTAEDWLSDTGATRPAQILANVGLTTGGSRRRSPRRPTASSPPSRKTVGTGSSPSCCQPSPRSSSKLARASLRAGRRRSARRRSATTRAPQATQIAEEDRPA